MTAIHRPLDRSFRRLVQAASLAIGLGLAAVVPASAQETGDNIVLQAVEAAKKLESLTAKVKLSGAGGFKDFVPTADGTIHLLKGKPNEEDLAWTSRVDADYIHKKGEEQQQITAVRSPLILAYVDHDKKSVEERSRNSNRTIHSSVIDLLAIPELTAAEPYRRELREGESWTNAGRETVNDVECDVVEIRYDMTKGSNPNANQIIRTPGAKWYFGVEDRIPRRVERITDEGMISFTIVLDLTDVKINPGIEPEAMEIDTPEGYSRTISSKRTTKDGVEKIASPGPIRAPAVDDAPSTIDPSQVKLPAHGFELVDADGNEVTLDSLQGNIAVLYFWGTWRGECKPYNPLVSDLVTTFEGEPVKVLGLPVREGDESKVRAAMDKYNHTLLLDPSSRAIGCDVTARAYKVRRYPTIYVIGAESQILSVHEPESTDDPVDVMTNVENKIREALAAMN